MPEARPPGLAFAELTSDQELLAIADPTEVPVSRVHLRGLDP